MSDANDLRREAFRNWVKAKGGVAAVNAATGVPKTTLYSYLGGKAQSLLGTTQEAIASAFGVAIDEMFGGRMTVPVVGYVQAGAEAVLFGAGQGPFDHVPAPEGSTDHTVAVEIRGESLGPLLDGWLVYWDEVRTPPTEDMIGRLCVVGLPDDRVLVKQLQASRTPGCFHLLSNNEPPIFDAEIVWAARVKTMTPR